MSIPPRSALRAELRARRRALPARERMAAAETVAARLRALPELQGYVAGYWACDGELPLHALLAGPQPFVYCLPVLTAGKRLRFAPWRAGDPLVQNRYGIPEPDLAPTSLLAPEQLDCVLLPLLGFDRHGQRLGSGGGYYDRSFAFLRESASPRRPCLIGVGYALQEVDALAAEAWDVPLDALVSERETLRFAASPATA